MQGHTCGWDGSVTTRRDCDCLKAYHAPGDPQCRCGCRPATVPPEQRREVIQRAVARMAALNLPPLYKV